LAYSEGISAVEPQRAAFLRAVGAGLANGDTGLVEVVAEWTTLPEPVRRGVLAMIRAAANSGPS
jgi:hypothetical protein